MKLKTLTVSQVNEYISSYVSTNPIFSNMLISGEVFNLKKTGYGYTFLSLKDDNSKINAISYLEELNVENGDSIRVNGKINFYKKNGTYLLIINKYEKIGQGASYEQFKLLYNQLEKLGYFSKELKKSIPKFPENLGIVTSSKGAAIKDIISVIERRYPKVNVFIYDSKMQGIDAEKSISSAIEKLDNMNMDIIIISRGGGDTDELSLFNSKLIADSIFYSRTPIISAIGHEIDYVICDFVSDLRASTPSIAAELSVPNIKNIYEMINNIENSIKISYQNVLNKYSLKINGYKFLIQTNAPYKKIGRKRLFIEELISTIQKSYEKRIKENKEKFEKLNSILQKYNYSDIMSKGFAMIEKNGKLITSASNLSKGDYLYLTLENAKIKVKIEDIF